MSFKQYLNEFIDYKKLAPSITFEKSMDGYAYYFDDYKVSFDNEPITIFTRDANGRVADVVDIVDEHNAYNVGFMHDFSHELTGIRNEFYVYSRVLASIMKFAQKVKPVGLRFQAYDRRMVVLYDRFFKKYMNDYIQLDAEQFISKRYYDTLPPDKKQLVANHIKVGLPIAQMNVQDLKQMHNASRPINK